MAATKYRPELRLVPKETPERWTYSMLNSEQQVAVLKAINRCPRPASTLRIWNAAISCLEYDTGLVKASAEVLADIADLPPSEARRGLAELARIGALLRVARGRYHVNPRVAWAGSQAGREALAAQTRPVLQLVHDADS